MHIDVTAPRGALVDALKTVSYGLSTRPAVPILGHVRLDASDGALTVSAFDYESAVSTTVDAKVATDGAALAHHRELTKLLGALVKGQPKRDADRAPVTVRANDDGMTVECGGYAVPVESGPLNDYPTLPDVAAVDATLDRAAFTREITRVSVCASNDATLPMLTAIRVAVSPDAVTLAATDRFRLAESVVDADTSGREVAASLPRHVVGLVKQLTADTVSVGITDDGSAITVASGATVAVVRGIDAEFPHYRKLFPEPGHTVTVSRAALTETVGRGKAVLDAMRSEHLRIAYRPWTVTATPDMDGATAPDVEADTDATGEIRFNAAFLADALATFASDTLTLHITSENKPMVITGDAEPGYRHLVMPVRQPS